jgi:PAS domain S-box-containing protein
MSAMRGELATDNLEELGAEESAELSPSTGSLMTMFASKTAEDYLEVALGALGHSRAERRAVLDELPVPIYLTDAGGLVTYWNQACVDFAGREPTLGKDRWCVTWEIHTTTDEPLPHDQCPMAVAIRERREIRGEVAIAMRPDGSRKAFRPYPTPLFDADGHLAGAINMLIDVSEEQEKSLADQAARCRRLAGAVCDQTAAGILRRMAKGYEANAAALRVGALTAP